MLRVFDIAIMTLCGVSVAGCGTATCTTMEPGELARSARSFRIDVYDGATRCDGSRLAAGAPAPLASKSAVAGEPLALDVAPGKHTIVLIAFADEGGTQPIGSACAERELGGGSASCLGLEVAPLPDGGGGVIIGGCEDVSADLSNCGACGRSCSSAGVSAPLCAAGLCAPQCVAGRGDCNRPIAPMADDGCETNLYDVAHCGACNQPCTLDHATAKCPSGTCLIESCADGFFDCDGAASTGCECAGVDKNDGQKGCCPGGRCQASHANGFGQTFSSCTPSGTFDQALATDAAAAYPMANEKDTFQQICPNGTTKVVCKRTTNTNGANAACVCWAYEDSGASPAVGKALRVTGTNTCMCPTSTGTSWQ